MDEQLASIVLLCLIRRIDKSGVEQYLMIPKTGDKLCFPATKFRPEEDLYTALDRVIKDDLKLSGSVGWFPEVELSMIRNQGKSQHFPGLKKDYYLYPVEVSFEPDLFVNLKSTKHGHWKTLKEIADESEQPNIRAIVAQCQKIRSADAHKDSYDQFMGPVKDLPSMEARANHWASMNNTGVRVATKKDILNILDGGNRAFNLRVADPYLPYQKQGLGFTWSFFSPKDKQDIHVHGEPAVEIYGILEGTFLLWYKPMNERGARVWKKLILNSGDWVEVAALNCHFGCWLTQEGLGTVIKAAGSGELAGVGRIGISGKTTCKDCPVQPTCQKHPEMFFLMSEHQKDWKDRDWDCILATIENH